MKKQILLALTAVMMAGCYSQDDIAATIEGDDFATFEFDSCEYLLRIGGYLAHKGNCKYCAARRQKELEELVIKLKK